MEAESRAVQITFKLFATLSEFLPQGADNQVAVDLPEGTPVQAVIDRFRLPQGLVHLVLVNGEYVPPSARAARVLHDGDALALWPPIAGG
jgi:sulfur carrier protein ThiS